LSTLCERSRSGTLEFLAASSIDSASTSIHEVCALRALPAFRSPRHRSQDSSYDENTVHPSLAVHNAIDPPARTKVPRGHHPAVQHRGIHDQRTAPSRPAPAPACGSAAGETSPLTRNPATDSGA